jgi:exosortase A-associated hydrolase 2
MTRETAQFFFNKDGKRLFSILHEPDASARPPLGVVFCAPLFEEKLWSHRVLVNAARTFAKRGMTVLRFDYFGDGESEGKFEEASVHSRCADILDAVDFCRSQTAVTKIYLLGLCYGATLALRTALTDSSVAGAVAWAPVLEGDRYANELLRAHLSTQIVLHRKVIHDREALVGQIMAGQTVNTEGYEIGRALYSEICNIELLPLLRSATNPIMVMQIAPGERIEPQYAALANLTNPPLRFERVRELRFWTQQKRVFPPCEELFARTAQWLEQVAAI